MFDFWTVLYVTWFLTIIPIPDPQTATPTAKARLRSNQWLTETTAGK